MSVPPEQPETVGQPGRYGRQPGDSGPQSEYDESDYAHPAAESVPQSETGASGFPAGFPGQGGRPPVPPGRRGRTLPWLPVAGGLVVVGIVLVVLFTSGAVGGAGNRGNPDAVAASVADSLTNRNTGEARAAACDGTSPVGDQVLQRLQSYQVTAQVKGKAQVYGQQALATIHLSFLDGGHTLDMDSALYMDLRDGHWCVPAAGLQPDGNSVRIDGRQPGDLGQAGLPSGAPVPPR